MAESTAPDRIPLTIEGTPAQKHRLEQHANETGQPLEAVAAAAIDRAFPPSQSKEREEGGRFKKGLSWMGLNTSLVPWTDRPIVRPIPNTWRGTVAHDDTA